jgi:hypothetical protein
MNDYIINLIQSHGPHIPTEDYSHMVMENKHMVDGDGGGDDGDEEALEIPLSGVESRILQPPKMKIAMAAALWTS